MLQLARGGFVQIRNETISNVTALLVPSTGTTQPSVRKKERNEKITLVV